MHDLPAVRIADGVHYRRLFDDEIVIINVDTGWQGALNHTAGAVLELLADGLPETEIVRSLCAHFEVSETEAADAVGDIIAELIDNGTVVPRLDGRG